MIGLITFNQLNKEEARKKLLKTCGSGRWVDKMLERRPFASRLKMLIAAGEIWENECETEDWVEAFSHHPKIGDIESLKKKFADTLDWASSEQAGVSTASQGVIAALAELNKQYEEKFGYIFIVNATGKSAEEMLGIIQARLEQDPLNEIDIAKREQFNITALRIEKMLEELE